MLALALVEDTALAGLIGGGIGALGASLAAAVTQWLTGKRERSRRREIAARDVLILVERFAREHGELRDEADGETRVRKRAALEVLTDEIAARALEIDQGVAREHMRTIATALWYCISKAAQLVATKPPPFPDVPLVREAAREVLGAVMRGESIARSFDVDTMRLLVTARDARAILEGALKAVRTP
jgi:hypothetical protein